ncbi:7766_t:CDS:2, partial [Cetraspora pellucida]
LKPSWQSKTILIPNHWQNTKEQREGLEQLKKIVQEEGQGKKGMPLTYQRQPNNPKKEICVRLGGELLTFYQRLAPSSKTLILERALGSYYQKLS